LSSHRSFRACHTASDVPSSTPSAPRAMKFREVRSTSTKIVSPSPLVKATGLPRPGTPSLFGARPLDRSRARELCNRYFHLGCLDLRLGHPRSRHEVASRVYCCALLLSSRPAVLAIERPVFSRCCSPTPRMDAGPSDRRAGTALRSGQLEIAIDAPLLRDLPPRMRARRPESPRVEVLPSNGEEEGNVKPRLADSRTPLVTRSTYQGPFDGPSIAPTFPISRGRGTGGSDSGRDRRSGGVRDHARESHPAKGTAPRFRDRGAFRAP
jgi:hypothetical protein